MGYSVAMPTRSYRHLSAEAREAVSLGLAHGHSLRTMALVLGRAHSTVSRELARNVTRTTLSSLHATHVGDRSDPSAAATTHTPGSLAVAIRQDAPDRGLFARADCRESQPCVS